MIEAPEETGVYLLHFSEKVSYAQHYVGFAENIRRRVDVHLAAPSRWMQSVTPSPSGSGSWGGSDSHPGMAGIFALG